MFIANLFKLKSFGLLMVNFLIYKPLDKNLVQTFFLYLLWMDYIKCLSVCTDILVNLKSFKIYFGNFQSK